MSARPPIKIYEGEMPTSIAYQRKPHEYIEKPCQMCKSIYTPTGPRQKYCQSCQGIVWAFIPGYEKRYEISTSGLVRDCATGKIITQSLRKIGSEVHLYKGSERRKEKTHRLLLKTFLPIEDDALHSAIPVTDDPHNMCLENWRWSYVGGRGGRSILKPDEVKDIRRLIMTDSTLTYKELGARYGVSSKTIQSIISWRKWKHIS